MPPETTVILQLEDAKMSDPNALCDVADDFTQLELESAMSMHTALMAQVRGNAQNVTLIRRQAANRYFMQENPIHAAAVEKILSKT